MGKGGGGDRGPGDAEDVEGLRDRMDQRNLVPYPCTHFLFLCFRTRIKRTLKKNSTDELKKKNVYEYMKLYALVLAAWPGSSLSQILSCVMARFKCVILTNLARPKQVVL